MAIEQTFIDRVPTYPGRVKLTPVSGQTNTYDMVRADVPLVAGTPMDKATFDSITTSRLTGRYYQPTVTRDTSNGQTYTINSIPQAGWNSTTPYTATTLGGWEIYGSQTSVQSDNITSAFDGNLSTYWMGIGGTTNYIGFKLPSPTIVNKIKSKFSYTNGDIMVTRIEASNDWINWVNLTGSFYTGSGSGLTEYTLSNSTPYFYYRFNITVPMSIGILCYGIEISEYYVSRAVNNFILASGVPLSWTTGQKITLEIPTTVNTAGVTSNTLNNITINTILQPSRRYELRYTGTAFVAKEV